MTRSLAWMLLLCAAAAADEETVTVEATGRAPIVGGDEGKAGDEALVDAQRLAVEQGAGVLLLSETEIESYQLVRDTIRTKAAGYLASYEVLDRGRGDEGLYRVRIRARVKLAAVAADLLEIEAVFERLNRPRLMVVFEELDRGRPSTLHLAGNAAQEALLEKKFDLVDATQMARIYRPEVLDQALAGEPGPLLQIATDEGVEVAVVGRVEVRLLVSPVAGVFAAGASIEAKAFETQTGRLIAVRSLDLGRSAARPGVAGVDADGACHGAFRKAARELFLGGGEEGDQNAFIGRILAAWATSPTMVQLELRKVSYAQRKAVLAALRGIRLIEEVTSRRYENEVLTLELRGRAGVEMIVEAVSGAKVGAMRIAITGLRGNVAEGELR